MRNYGDPPEKFDPSRPSRPSRSLKVIGTDTDRSAIYDFLLVFCSNYRPISYRFPDKERYLQKFPNVYLTSPARVPLEFCNGDGARKTRMRPQLPECQKV